MPKQCIVVDKFSWISVKKTTSLSAKISEVNDFYFKHFLCVIQPVNIAYIVSDLKLKNEQ